MKLHKNAGNNVSFTIILLNNSTTGGTMLLLVVTRSVIPITRKSKLETKIRSHPTPSDIKFAELRKFLLSRGFLESKGDDNAHYLFYKIVSGKYYHAVVAKPHRAGDGVKKNYITNVERMLEMIEFESEF